jgi:hypothetical protein
MGGAPLDHNRIAVENSFVEAEQSCDNAKMKHAAKVMAPAMNRC